MSSRKTLGRGLNSLIPGSNQKKEDISQYKRVNNKKTKQEENNESRKNEKSTVFTSDKANVSNDNKDSEVLSIKLSDIKARPGQPRKHFDDEALNDLAESIKEYGLLNPIVVTKKTDHYEILAGERRFRATQKLGQDTIDVIVKDFSQQDVEVLSLVENVQREDLSPIEEAEAYRKLADSYQMTQEQIAKTMGKSRSYIANTLRLLNLNDKEKEALRDGKISSSQARTLLSIGDEEERAQALEDFINNKTNIRKIEKSNKKKKAPAKKTEEDKAPNIDDILAEDLEERFMEKLGSKVAINKSGKSYKLVIDCYSIEDIEEIFNKIDETN